MSIRAYFDGIRRLRALRGHDDPISLPSLSRMQDFIDEWTNIAVRRKTDGGAPVDMIYLLPNDLQSIAQHVLDIGQRMRRSQLTGIAFHNTFQREVAGLAARFSHKGHVECFARCDNAAGHEEGGRIDVVWARQRRAVAIFEIDSTVKLKSFWKLKSAAASHKFWIYFGRDIWSFKMHLRQNDPEREIIPVIVPFAFAPRFAEVAAAKNQLTQCAGAKAEAPTWQVVAAHP